MKYRTLGRTGIRAPEVGFGCGNVGGVLIRGTHNQRVAAVRKALSLGIDYFDTAAAYGNGQSERHLGEVLRELKPDVHVATKFHVTPDDLKDIPGAIRRSLEGSLSRLQRDTVDLLQLHTNLADNEDEARVWVTHVLGKGGIADTLDQMQAEKLIGSRGFTAMGDTDAVHRVIDSGRFDTIQTYHNLINPSSGQPVPHGFATQDYRLVIDKAADKKMGVINVRVLAGGAVVGPVRAQLASARPGGDMATGNDYVSDLRRSQALSFLAQDNRTIAQASIRFALDNPKVHIVLVGFSNEGQIEDAAATVAGPSLTTDDMDRLRRLWATDFAG